MSPVIALRKAVMLRTRLRNRYNKDRTVENWNKFRKHRNSRVNLLRREKRNYYNNPDISKKFWKTVKPFFSDNLQTKNKTVLIEDETIISNDAEVAETMNELFVTVTSPLGINENSNCQNTTEGITYPIDKAVYKFSNHPSILKIKDHCQNVVSFHFQKVAPDAVDIEARDLNPKKATTHKTSHQTF